MKEESKNNPFLITSLNHVSLICRSVEASIAFYRDFLGFEPIRRPSFDFNGAWLFGHRVGIHLLQSDDPEILPKKSVINPKDNHISFQCENMGAVEQKLNEMGVKFIRQKLEEGGICVDQLFFHDPDGFMIEICNCENLPVIPLERDQINRSCSLVNLHMLCYNKSSSRSLSCCDSNEEDI